MSSRARPDSGNSPSCRHRRSIASSVRSALSALSAAIYDQISMRFSSARSVRTTRCTSGAARRLRLMPATSFGLHFGHRPRADRAFEPLANQFPQVLDGVAEQIAPLLPFAYSIANGLAGRSVVATIDDFPHEGGHFGGQGDGDLLDFPHEVAPKAYWNGMLIAYRDQAETTLSDPPAHVAPRGRAIRPVSPLARRQSEILGRLDRRPKLDRARPASHRRGEWSKLQRFC